MLARARARSSAPLRALGAVVIALALAGTAACGVKEAERAAAKEAQTILEALPGVTGVELNQSNDLTGHYNDFKLSLARDIGVDDLATTLAGIDDAMREADLGTFTVSVPVSATGPRRLVFNDRGGDDAVLDNEGSASAREVAELLIQIRDSELQEQITYLEVSPDWLSVDSVLPVTSMVDVLRGIFRPESFAAWHLTDPRGGALSVVGPLDDATLDRWSALEAAAETVPVDTRVAVSLSTTGGVPITIDLTVSEDPPLPSATYTWAAHGEALRPMLTAVLAMVVDDDVETFRLVHTDATRQTNDDLIHRTGAVFEPTDPDLGWADGAQTILDTLSKD